MPKFGRSSSHKPTTHPLCVCTVPTVFCEFEHRFRWRELRIPYLCGGALTLRSAPRSRLPGLHLTSLLGPGTLYHSSAAYDFCPIDLPLFFPVQALVLIPPPQRPMSPLLGSRPLVSATRFPGRKKAPLITKRRHTQATRSVEGRPTSDSTAQCHRSAISILQRVTAYVIGFTTTRRAQVGQAAAAAVITCRSLSWSS